MDSTSSPLTFAQAADALAAVLGGYRWADSAVSSPAQILSRYARPVDLDCLTPHRQFSEAELFATIDEHGLEIVRVDGGYTWSRDSVASGRRFRTVTGAALHALRHAAPAAPVCARASDYFAVAPWLAYVLEQGGEIVRHTPQGISFWAACGTDHAVSDDNALLIDIFERVVRPRARSARSGGWVRDDRRSAA